VELGILRSYRTPGGQRRFNERELRDDIQKLREERE
jgi:hypothetical protein